MVKAYTYDEVWKDKLISYNGMPIDYDKIGNPTTIGADIDPKSLKLIWEEGRRLKSITSSEKNISFKYNDAGIRTEKNVGGVVTKYHLIGDRVTYGYTEDINYVRQDTIYYRYDNADDLVSMNLSTKNVDGSWTLGVEYYYIRNGQGDIIGLLDGTGKQVVSYIYDSWGKVVSIGGELKDTVGGKNPYRYRGYRYDSETGLYYLNSRYYNPEWGRYLSADATVGNIGVLLSHNVFCYCENNPVNMIDQNGYWPKWAKNIVSDVSNFVTNKVSEAKATAKKVITNVSNTFSFSSWEPLGHKNWQYRHEEGAESTREEEHVHLRGEGKEYQQDIKGGRRTKQNPHGLPDPPKKVRKVLKEKTGWDWDKNASKNIIAKTLVISGGSYLVYRSIRMIPSLLPPLWWTIPTNILSP